MTRAWKWKSAAAFAACVALAGMGCGGGDAGSAAKDAPDSEVAGSEQEVPDVETGDDDDGGSTDGASTEGEDSEKDCEDRDGDGVKNCADNCPDAYNPDQSDADNDGIGDVCECDKHPDGEEPQPTPTPNPKPTPTEEPEPTPTPEPGPEPELACRMTGGGSVFTDEGMRVTHGFQLRAPETDHRQNLQVNWDGGNKFHLLDLTSATCVDDPALDEEMPVAGFDTFVATGTGRYNGVEGATIELTFTDDGEPGADDVATMTIRDADGNVVLEVSGELRHGNHQAHEAN